MGKKYKFDNTYSRESVDEKICIVSDQVAVNGKPIAFIVKNNPVRDDDSGWQFLSGEEKPTYVSNPHTASVFNLSDVLKHYPHLIKFMDEPVGTEIIL